MEAITVFTANAEEGRILKAFLKALKIHYIPTPTKKLQDLEATLTPAQLVWWNELKANIKAVEHGTTEGSIDLEDFLKDLDHADKIGSVIPT